MTEVPTIPPRRQTYLIQDPYDLDALEFIRTIEVGHGLRPVCFYTDPKARYYGERMFPELTGDLVERSVDVRRDDLASFVDEIRAEYDIVGVVPYREDTIEIAVELCRLLDLDWVDPDVLARFRDKIALKSFVRSVAPDVRVPECRLVEHPDDLTSSELPERFVVKPNHGFGNMSVGIFGRDEIARARDHVAAQPGTTWILEEFIGGVEYHVDGQVREAGDVQALAVFEYLRGERNGYPTVYLGEVQCRSSAPEFRTLVDYAERLLTATGLAHCPFHLEVKLDERGPCVIDLGARLPSEGSGKTISRLHPYRPSAYAIAAAAYLGLPDLAPDVVEWADYDARTTVLVFGVSESNDVIASIAGVEEVSARPEFVRWAIKPEVGHRLQITRDLLGASYVVELECPGGRDEALALADWVRETVVFNARRDMAVRAVASATDFARRAVPKLHWIGHRAAQRLTRRAA